jgi:hypothetical protein
MRVEDSSADRLPWSGDAGARRLFGLVRDACEGGEDLPSRLEAGLRAALVLLAAEPELAYELTVAPYMEPDDAALDGLGEWLGRFGGLLRSAAVEDPRASQESSFVAHFLIGGVRFQVGRLVLNGEASDLPRLLPGTLEALLAYYFEPGEPRRLAHIALAGRD